MFSSTDVVTNDGLLERAILVMEALSSMLWKTLVRLIIELIESSSTMMSLSGFVTIGASTTALTVTVKISSTVFPLELAVKVIAAEPD